MRKLLLCWAMAGSHLLYAQDPLDSIRTRLDHLFQPVKTAFPTKTFLESGDGLIPLPKSSETKKVMNLGRFMLLHQSIRTAQPPDKKWQELRPLAESFQTLARNRVPMSLLDAKVSLLRENAIQTGNLSYANEQFQPHSNGFFEDRRVMELTSTRATAEGPDVELFFPQSLWFTDQQSSEIHLQVKNESGGWHEISKGESFWLRSLPEGMHRFSYRIISDGDTSVGLTGFKVLLPSTQAGMIEWVIPKVEGRHAGGKATVQLAPGNSSGHVKNPVILVEGIDYYQVAPDLTEQGNSDWQTLKNVFNLVIANGQFYANADIIYLDFAEGADGIERNAEVLRDLIGVVNQDKVLGGSNTPNTVIGFSMGGLVGRFCLSKMARDGVNSQTTKLITNDSPHDGAHLPLGLQYLFHAFNGIVGRIPIVPYAKQAHRMLLAPASVQMLKYRANALNDYSENTWLNQVYKPMVTFPAGAQPFEFISTSSGSECGVVDVTPGQTYFNFDLSLGEIMSISDDFTSFITMENNWRFRVLAWAQGTTENSKILSFTVRFRKKFYNGLVSIGISLPELKANHPSNLPKLDFAPGGKYYMDDFGYKFLGGISTSSTAISLNSGLMGNFCFIPVKSALDMSGLENTDYFKAYNPWMNGLPASRVGTFRAAEPLGPLRNFRHGFLTDFQSKLIVNKVLNLPFNDFCPTDCKPEISVSGPGAICPGGSAPYYIQTTAGDNVQYQWSVSGGIELDGQYPNGEANFSVPSGNTNPNLLINAVVSKNSCEVRSQIVVDGTTILAPIEVRCGSNPNVTNPGDALCQNSGIGKYFYIESIPIGSNYQINWIPLPDDYGVLPEIEPYMSNGAYRNALIRPNGVAVLRFRIEINSDCGSRSKNFEIPFFDQIGSSTCILCDQGSFIRVEPPVVQEGTEAEVLVIKPGEGLGTIEIRDLEGHLIETKTSDGESETMDVSQLEAGNYVVRVQNPTTGEWEEKPLEVKPKTDLAISPNPGTDLVQLNMEGAMENMNWRVTVSDRFGTIRFLQNTAFKPEIINVEALPSDLYLIKVENDQQVFQTWFRKN